MFQMTHVIILRNGVTRLLRFIKTLSRTKKYVDSVPFFVIPEHQDAHDMRPHMLLTTSLNRTKISSYRLTNNKP
jgi:hypothetical protein